jgi:hypothetical protein
MNLFSLTKKTGDVQTSVAQATLEDLMHELDRYGEPSLSKHDNMSSGRDWLCRINARLTATGVSFEAKAWAATPLDAARECLQNLQQAIKKVSAAA